MTYPFEPYKIDTHFNRPTSYGTHEGTDFNGLGGGNTDCGFELKAIKSGVCVHTSISNKDYGNLLVIECKTDKGTFWVRYCHCQEIRVGVGDEVKEGQVIATMGSTGNSTACHLHLDVLKVKPVHWRYYTQTVTAWFVNPINFIEEYMPILDDPETIEKIKEDIIRLEAEIVQERQRTTDARNDRSAMLEALNLHPNTGREKAVEAIKKLLDDLQQSLNREKKLSLESEACQNLRGELTDARADFFVDAKAVTGTTFNNYQMVIDYLEHHEQPDISKMSDRLVIKEAVNRILNYFKNLKGGKGGTSK